MARPVWDRLLGGYPWHRGAGAYPLAAYSEFLPPPWLVRLPYGTMRTGVEPLRDPACWTITEHEELHELRPGLEQVATQVVRAIAGLGHGEAVHRVARSMLADNPYWPARLAREAGRLFHERYVTLIPLALSRTQDALGRIRWTLFGASELGPARTFWQGATLDMLRGLLIRAFGIAPDVAADPVQAGFRIFPQGRLAPPLDTYNEGRLPAWTKPLLLSEGEPVDAVRFLLTFRPFALLPEAIQSAYLAGRLCLIPFPGSLVFWGAPLFLRLRRELPAAMQIPLLWHVERHAGPGGLRVPQSGWMHEPRQDEILPHPDRHPLRNTYRRTHRHVRVPRDAPAEQVVSPREDRMAHVLFDASEAIGLYAKPMARNAQLWTADGRLLLDGPAADHDAIERAAREVNRGGTFGYRFLFPAMRVGGYELFWHRLMAAYLPSGSDRPVVLDHAPLGVVTATLAGDRGAGAVIELRPEFVEREPYVAAATLFTRADDPRPHQTARNCRKLLEAAELLGTPLDRSFARKLLTIPEHVTLDEWLDALPGRTDDPERGRWLTATLAGLLNRHAHGPSFPEPLTLQWTSRRGFEVGFWNTIAALASGRFRTRNNADCTRDPATRRALRGHLVRDLDALGDYLRARHARAIARAGTTGRAVVGDLPFHWRTDFAFTWSDGWRHNQGPDPAERDLIVVIPGRNRSRAVIMADHYDTAYMENRYLERSTRDGPRLAAPGADDNSSATATLLMAAPCFLELSRTGRLGCDVWLVHLTGEEFPADCLGARHLAECLVEGTLAARLPSGDTLDLSHVRVEGVYVLDMVAHDNPHRRGVFQIAPGDCRESFLLARTAHAANEAWNACVPRWNRHPRRRANPLPLGEGGRRPGEGQRANKRYRPPLIARHPTLFGEVRPHDDPRSTLFNTDGQIFSDAGIPVVLFMEDYDIDRPGYHDSHDTMANIDLDYGAALAAIAIETVAQTAQTHGRKKDCPTMTLPGLNE
jgi:hypothetical protein